MHIALKKKTPNDILEAHDRLVICILEKKKIYIHMNIWNIFTIFAKNRQTRDDETKRNNVLG